MVPPRTESGNSRFLETHMRRAVEAWGRQSTVDHVIHHPCTSRQSHIIHSTTKMRCWCFVGICDGSVMFSCNELGDYSLPSLDKVSTPSGANQKSFLVSPGVEL